MIVKEATQPPLLHLGQAASAAPCPLRNSEEILAYIKNLPLEGLLKKGDGFLYVKLPDSYVSDVISLLNEPGTIPPPYFEEQNPLGANICALLKEELADWDQVKEIGNNIPFEVTGAYSIKPYGWDGIDKVYYLTVKSELLEKIRKKAGLNPKINGLEFHIIFAVKKAKESLSFDVGKLIADPSTLSSFEKA